MTRSFAYRFDSAIVRAPAKSVVRGLRAGNGEDPTYEGVAREHAAYVDALGGAGVNVAALPALEAFPDSLFVEDPVLVFPEGAVLLRSAAPNRAGEAAALKPHLQEHFDRVVNLPEGFADGGDILTTGREVMIGLSARTDATGAKALAELLGSFGRKARIVETPANILHFKSDCGLLDDDAILTTKRLATTGVFDDYAIIETPEGEEAAANALRVNDVVLLGDRFPKTAEALEKSGFDVTLLPTTEIGRIDAGLSCMSLRWRRLS